MLAQKICRCILIPLLISITFSGLIAQPVDTKFEHISLEHGLSQSIINTIMKDSKGFMWFGTQSGLNKYDGYEFVIYKNNPFDSTAISNNLINSTFEDGEGFIWIGTGGGGLNKFNRETEEFTRYRHNPQNPKSISSDFVFFSFEDKSKNIWVFTGEGGVDIFNKSTGEFEHLQHNPDDPISLSHNNINWVYEDLLSEIWFGTQNGLNKFNREDKSFERLFYRQESDKKSGKTY
ncbi:MAG: two-component regulator propeller domain-containing protein, partial [Ignavibacteriaceae bacterium]